ncbi:fimbrial biogenesis chaperone [Vibrio aphrogenes]|uniref:fimbrial biogenesis chaperone n=1 Tax=Vibrio aphrogenes TaxID=1891186 RepID=UPI000B35137A|nr:molecular chaperone [Vibrio aphrogenes]
MKFFIKILLLMLFSVNAMASVTLGNTRIIYPSNTLGKDIVFNNNDHSDYIIQAWVDNGDIDSTPEDADSDFILMPAMFKIQGKSNQVLRMMYSGQELPLDRESIFYFNFVQFPLSKTNDNQMVVVLKNRVKVLYRPKGLASSLIKSVDKLTYNIKKGSLNIKNDSGYYINIANVIVKSSNEEQMINNVTISPFSSFKKSLAIKNPEEVKVSFINDQGGTFTRNMRVAINNK